MKSFFQAVLWSIVAAVGYGIIHDQITIRICLEYFTIGHPPLPFEGPTLLGLAWGVLATWWVGLLLGIPLGLVAWRRGLAVTDLAPDILRLLAVMGVLAALSALLGYALARSGVIYLLEPIRSQIPVEIHSRFVAAGAAHLASYLVGFGGGLVIIWRSWKMEAEPSPASSLSTVETCLAGSSR